MMKNIKASRFLMFLAAAVVVIITFFIVFGKRTVGDVAAKEFVKQTKKDLDSVAGKIHYYQNSFAKVEQLFGKAQGAFYEITTSRTYEESVVDTKKDIQDIEAVLKQIEQLKDKKKLTSPPTRMEPLAEKVSEYYSTVEESLNKLLVHEQTQMKLLNISGDRYNQLIGRFDSTKDNEEYTKIILELGELAPRIAKEMETAEIPEEEKEIFSNVISQHRLQANFFAATVKLLKNQDPDFQRKYGELMTQFGNDMNALRSEISTAQKWMDKSRIKESFAKAAELEKEISDFIKEFSKKGTVPQITTAPSPTTVQTPTDKVKDKSGTGKKNK